jgi:tetratricopeptide (TPR) repeat protein
MSELHPSTDAATRWIEAQENLANTAMRRGIALLNSRAVADLREAVASFDHAIALRQRLPPNLSPWIRYNLSGGWINRGDALTRLGSIPELEEAERSYKQGLELVEDVPLGLDASVPRRIAIAWLNRGLCLQRQLTDRTRAEALDCFDRCRQLLESAAAAGISDRACLLAAAWTNRGNTLLDAPVCMAYEARAAAVRAIASLLQDRSAPGDDPQPDSRLEVALKARHVLCRAIARLICKQNREPSVADLVAEATDAVESGLKLRADASDCAHLSQLKNDLFRFGARVYRSYQPQFLSEFLLEFLEDDGRLPDERRLTALGNIWAALRALQKTGFSAGNGTKLESAIRQIREFRVVEEHLH